VGITTSAPTVVLNAVNESVVIGVYRLYALRSETTPL
jgi:hypothetical protein